MATLAHAHAIDSEVSQTSNWLQTYRRFVARAEFYRVGWAAAALIIQGCVLAPAVLLTMFYYGGGDWQLLVANLAFLGVLVPILSAMGVKYILPAFSISFLIHLAIILINVL